MNDFERHASGMQAQQTRFGSSCPTFSWADKEWQMVPNSFASGKGLDPGGFVLDFDLSFEVLIAQFGDTLPEPKQEIAYLDESFRIQKIEKRPGNLQWKISCVSDQQGA